MFIEPIK